MSLGPSWGVLGHFRRRLGHVETVWEAKRKLDAPWGGRPGPGPPGRLPGHMCVCMYVCMYTYGRTGLTGGVPKSSRLQTDEEEEEQEEKEVKEDRTQEDTRNGLPRTMESLFSLGFLIGWGVFLVFPCCFLVFLNLLISWPACGP